MGSPENKEAPNRSERKPRREASEEVKRALGRAAMRGAQK